MLQCIQQRLQRPLFPLVVLLAGDAQRLCTSVAIIWPKQTWKMTSARCLALVFIYSGFTAGMCGFA
jgi:hypothetical protein